MQIEKSDLIFDMNTHNLKLDNVIGKIEIDQSDSDGINTVLLPPGSSSSSINNNPISLRDITQPNIVSNAMMNLENQIPSYQNITRPTSSNNLNIMYE